jgi:ubiquinone/menaquinone biosynthesis C-methylase UbiE
MNQATSTAAQTPNTAAVTPERIMQFAWAFGVTRALASSLEMHLFTHLAQGRNTPEEIAAREKATPRGIRMLLDAVVSVGLVQRQSNGKHVLAPDAAKFLVEGEPAYIGAIILFLAQHGTENWRDLTEIVKTGQPVRKLDDPVKAAEFWDKLIDPLFNLNYAAATMLGKELARVHPTGAYRVLDVAAGSGVWGIGAAQADKRASVTSFDLEGSLKHARANVEKMGLKDRFEFLPGDLRTTDLGTARYEAAILGHILHSEGATQTQALFAKMARALKPGGTLAIAEFLVAPDRSGPPSGTLFALNMLAGTTEGDTFSLPQLTGWLEKAGFDRVRELPAPAPSPLVLATKR